MSFNPNVPLVTDLLPVSQKQILANFQAIYNAFNENHVPLAETDDFIQGMHNELLLRPQTVDPTTSSSQIALYNKLVGSPSIPQLFFRPSSSATPIQMTNSNFSTTNTPNVSFRQSTFIAGPFTIYIGFFVSPASGTVVTLTPSTTLLNVNLGTYLSKTQLPLTVASAIATNITGNQFTISYVTALTPAPFVVYYSAIGNS